MPLKTQMDEQPTLNLTPMIDIVFLLIIFFMVGTKFTELERKMSLEVPQVSDVESLAPVPTKRIVNVYHDGSVSLDRKFLTLSELEGELREAASQYANIGVIVRGDGKGTFQSVAKVLSVVRKAGVKDMGISVRLAHKGD